MNINTGAGKNFKGTADFAVTQFNPVSSSSILRVPTVLGRGIRPYKKMEEANDPGFWLVFAQGAVVPKSGLCCNG